MNTIPSYARSGYTSARWCYILHEHPYASFWPLISLNRITSYFVVAIFTGVIYDWVLTFGLEVELVWSQHWSLMTVLFLSVRYLGISYSVLVMLLNVPTISMTDAG